MLAGLLALALASADSGNAAKKQKEIKAKSEFLIAYDLGDPDGNGSLPEVTAFRMTVKAYPAPDKKLEGLRTFAFDYSSTDNPNLEKELFKMVKDLLVQKGMEYSENNPEILITMSFYSGPKQQYAPPSTIVVQRFSSGWNYEAIKPEPAPAAPAPTEKGASNCGKFFRSIRLNFLDFAALAGSEKLDFPPVLWTGEVDGEGSSTDLRVPARAMLGELLGEFPQATGKPGERKVYQVISGALGIGVDQDDYRIVRKVIPDSVADLAGIRPGDIILSINKQKLSKNYADVYQAYGANYQAEYRAHDPYYKYILSNNGATPVELKVKSKQNRELDQLRITPELETNYFYCDAQNICSRVSWQ